MDEAEFWDAFIEMYGVNEYVHVRYIEGLRVRDLERRAS